MTVYWGKPSEVEPEKPAPKLDPEQVEQIILELSHMSKYISDTLEDIHSRNQGCTTFGIDLIHCLSRSIREINTTIDTSKNIVRNLRRGLK